MHSLVLGRGVGREGQRGSWHVSLSSHEGVWFRLDCWGGISLNFWSFSVCSLLMDCILDLRSKDQLLSLEPVSWLFLEIGVLAPQIQNNLHFSQHPDGESLLLHTSFKAFQLNETSWGVFGGKRILGFGGSCCFCACTSRAFFFQNRLFFFFFFFLCRLSGLAEELPSAAGVAFALIFAMLSQQ